MSNNIFDWCYNTQKNTLNSNLQSVLAETFKNDMFLVIFFIEDAMRRDTAAPRFVQVPFRGMRFLAVGGIIWNVVSCFEFSIFVCVPCSVLVLGGPWRFLVVELLSLARQSRNPATAL